MRCLPYLCAARSSPSRPCRIAYRLASARLEQPVLRPAARRRPKRFHCGQAPHIASHACPSSYVRGSCKFGGPPGRPDTRRGNGRRPDLRQQDIREACDVLFRPVNLMCAFLKLTRHDRRPEEPEGPQRLVPCAQARWLGHGTIELAARAPGTSRKTMAAGAAEPEAGGSAGISCWRCDTESRKTAPAGTQLTRPQLLCGW